MATLEAILASLNYCNSTVILVIVVFCFLFLLCFHQTKGFPVNWPVIGMLPICFPITVHLCDNFTKFLQNCDGTLAFKGPWFANRDMIFTADPRNVQHVLSTKFSIYPKGPDTRKIFEIYGENLFTSDHDVWRRDRKFAHSFLHDHRLHHFSVKINQKILEKGLIPVLDHACENGAVVDLQDVFQRYMLDATCMMITGHNFGSLGVGFPKEALLSALHNASDAILMRHILPENIWKFQRWLGIGVEKKLSKAYKILDDATEEFIKAWQNQASITKDGQESFDAINFYFMEKHLLESMGESHHGLRENIKGLIFGGTDTTSPVLPWFFWLLSKNPTVECKIRKELNANFRTSIKAGKRLFFNPDELNKLFYLHGALCETLRLFPPVPFEPRTSIRPDILPSGHYVKPGIRILVCTYAMGRMKSIWGEDCLEFKPERWISERGGKKPVASNKFTAFSSGPRICMGKDMAFMRLKAVVATVLYNYQIQILEDQPAASPATSIFLHIKHGLLAKVIEGSA